MNNVPEATFARAFEALAHGQQCEARRELPAAIAGYDEALAATRELSSHEPKARHLRGIVLMNRANALQKLALPATLAEAVRVYDDAIAVFETLPHTTTPALRNHLGAAWLNRGHALLGTADSAGAGTSFERSATLLETLPLADDISYRLNLAGARTNLAHVIVPTDPARARLLAQASLAILGGHEQAHPALAEMSLRTRRALVMAIGELLQRGLNEPDLVAEATDAIDEGLALAGGLETRGISQLRPLALRLFFLGAQLYRIHQPHFLAEFVLETLAVPGFAADADFRSAANEAIALAFAEVQRPRTLFAGEAGAQRLLETARSLRHAQDHLSTLTPNLPTHAA